MKRYPLIIILLLAFSTFGYATDETKSVDAPIREVTVFRNGAQITRQAEVTLSPGRNEIVFRGLSPFLNPQTIQLSGIGGEFLILSISHSQNYLSEQPQDPRIHELTVRRDSLEQLLEEQATTASILDRELNILLSNTTLKGDQQNLSADELKQAMDYFHQKLTELENRKLGLKREQQRLREELDRVQSQIAELNNSGRRNYSEITAVFQAESNSQVQLNLNYMVSNAGWLPSYDVRAADVAGPLNLFYKADIIQNTGVDWNDVILTITSATAEQNGTLPQLYPWYLRFYTSPPPPAKTMDLGAELSLDMPLSAQQEIVVSGYSHNIPVQEIQNQTSFSYKIDLPYSVPSGGKPLTIAINNHRVPAEYRYHTVPKLRDRAFLTARVSDWGQYNLLAGTANLYFENTYVGRSSIDPRTVGDTLSFSLGQDESVVIERNKLREFEKKNFFGNKLRESYVWEISVRNSKDKPVDIEVKDQVPVSQHQDIRVSLKESSGATHNPETGMLSWVLQIPPGETQTLRVEYEVEYPKGKQVRF